MFHTELQCYQISLSQITASNSAEAQMFLQTHDWNLEKAVRAYLDSNSADESTSTANLAKVRSWCNG